jgi:hypothetical protein
MRRAHATLAIGALVGLAAGAQAQRKLLGEVVDDAKRPLAGARVSFHPTPLPALTGLAACRHALPVVPAVTTHTGADGRFSLAVAVPADTQGLRGALVVVRGSVGAVLIEPRLPATIVGQELTEVRLARRADVDVQVVSPDGAAFAIGSCVDTESVRLPGGTYRLLVRNGRRIEEHRLELAGGETVRLPAQPGTRIVQLDPHLRATLRFPDWPHVVLAASGDLELPADGRPVRLLVQEHHGACDSFREVWVGADDERTAVHAAGLQEASLAITTENAEPLAGVRLLCVRETADERLELVSLGVADESGRAGYVAADGTVLVALHDGFAPASIRASERVDALALPRGHELAVQVLDAAGPPPTGVTVELDWPDAPLLRRSYRSDGVGRVHCPNLPAGRMRVCIRDEHFVPEQHVVVVSADHGRLSIEADRGHTLRGTVVLPGAGPAAGAIVTAADPFGELRPAPRTAVTAADGTFSITGLPESQVLRVSARWLAGESSYITPRVVVEVDESVLRLQLQSEDPALPGTMR